MTEQNMALKTEKLQPELWKEVQNCYNRILSKHLYWGPKKYYLPETYKGLDEEIYKMPLRADDIFVVSFPRSGTTWTQELVWLVANDLNFDKAKSVILDDRYTFIEESMFLDETAKEKIRQDILANNPSNLAFFEKSMTSCVQRLANIKTQRFVKTHLPLSLLPPNLLDEAKVIYVARDPRDVVVSYYHFTKSIQVLGYNGDFKQFVNLFTRGLLSWTPIMEHIKEAWQQRHKSNMLFLFYEDMCKDLHACIKRVAEFLGRKYTEEEIAQLVEHLRIDNFKKNKAVDAHQLKDIGIFKKDMEFVRKGKSGGWNELFDGETTEKLNKWITENLKDSDLIFPSK